MLIGSLIQIVEALQWYGPWKRSLGWLCDSEAQTLFIPLPDATIVLFLFIFQHTYLFGWRIVWGNVYFSWICGNNFWLKMIWKYLVPLLKGKKRQRHILFTVSSFEGMLYNAVVYKQKRDLRIFISIANCLVILSFKYSFILVVYSPFPSWRKKQSKCFCYMTKETSHF